MAFATNKPMRSLNKVSGGALEEWQKTAKEDGSVSNSSSTTTGRGSSVYDESEANKARNDGSGSSNDSGSTMKAYKESTQDESCSSGSRSEQAQCEDSSEQPKQQNSLKTVERGERERGERKEKKEKKKRRSASSESAERSREREKRRRKQQQQVVNKNRKAGEGGVGGQSMFWDGFQWVPRADTGITNDINASRKNRRLYLGNLPYHLGVTEDSFSKQLYETMRDRSMCNDPNQNPVLHVWFARDKGANYGFCEIASQEETERALQLDGMLVLGVPVSIKRPNDAVSPLGPGKKIPMGPSPMGIPWW
eukprot:symbB.v1.2.024859.t1/scaffold2291.1/size145394/3